VKIRDGQEEGNAIMEKFVADREGLVYNSSNNYNYNIPHFQSSLFNLQ
jgi:hypothetical protein